MDLDVSQYMSIFVEESREHLQSMNDVLLELERNPEDLDHINEIFRVAHTIKGMAGTMGFQHMATLTHDMENVLSAVRSHEIELTSGIIDILFECFDVLDSNVNAVIESGNESSESHDAILEKLNAILAQKGKVSESVTAVSQKTDDVSNSGLDTAIVIDDVLESLMKKAKTDNMNVFSIRFVLSQECVLKSARVFVVNNMVEEYGEIIRSVPSVTEIEEEKFGSEFTIAVVTGYEKDRLFELLHGISEVDQVDIVDLYTYSLEKKSVTDEKDNEESTSGLQPSDEKQPVTTPETKNETSHPAKSSNSSKVAQKSVRVDIDRLDSLMNLVSELIIIKTRMDDLSENDTKENMNDTIEYLERITTNLNEAVMKVRMVPVERVFNRFPRLVRDLSKELGKEIELQMSGEETEVDRTVIDEIGDPLLHLIRNSLDHGVEKPDVRIQKGKPAQGTVVLKAYPDGNNVVIEVGDDGAGINEEKIAKKAIEKGLITEHEADMMSVEDKIALLFRPGFSTAEVVSDVSGRGVGLDVVKSKIEAINGVVEVETVRDRGSKFIIRLPLTLAIIHALLIRLGSETYAIPLSSISEIITIESNAIRDVQGQDVVLFREKTLPIVDLKKFLDITDENTDNELTVVVIRKGMKQAGVIVDSLIGQQEIVIKSLGSFLGTIQYLSGATILGDGSISLIIDTNALI